jgi:hypothetical protein
VLVVAILAGILGAPIEIICNWAITVIAAPISNDINMRGVRVTEKRSMNKNGYQLQLNNLLEQIKVYRKRLSMLDLKEFDGKLYFDSILHFFKNYFTYCHYRNLGIR